MVKITGGQASDAADAIADRLTRRAILGQRYDAGMAKNVTTMLDALERDLVGQIARIDATGVVRAAARRARLSSLLDETRKQIRTNFKRIDTLTHKDLEEIIELEAKATIGAMKGGFQTVGVKLSMGLPTDATYAALAEDTLVLGSPLDDWWASQSAKLQRDFASQMRLGVQAGETVQQLTRRVVGGTADGTPIKGIMDASRSVARTLVRSSVASVQNSARLAVYEANDDVIEELQHLSRLDGRTSPPCIERAGKAWDAKTKEPIGHKLPFHNPPIHHNCRSVLIPVVIKGERPTDQDGEAWAKKLGTEDQNAVFGRGKAELYRAGKITVGDLIDQQNRPITLQALRETAS